MKMPRVGTVCRKSFLVLPDISPLKNSRRPALLMMIVLWLAVQNCDQSDAQQTVDTDGIHPVGKVEEVHPSIGPTLS